MDGWRDGRVQFRFKVRFMFRFRLGFVKGTAL